MAISTIKWSNGCVKIIDQTKLPQKLEYIYCRDIKTLWSAIRNLSVRGAPALGVAAAFGVILGIKEFKKEDKKAFVKFFHQVRDYLRTSRPTAVNLFCSLNRMEHVLKRNPNSSIRDLKKKMFQEAMDIFNEDKKVCRAMGYHGARLIKNAKNILTICNAGALATVDYGTALGVFYAAKTQGKKFRVYSCETRPLLQGARLTTWELLRENIDTILICDNMAATLMKQRKIDMIFTGADRIASNGDTANKIGTYNLAVLARYHKIPFYVVAPFSTFDMGIKDGSEIPIEERKSQEVSKFMQQCIAPKNVQVYNPAFDVTDQKLITAIITEYGVITPPFKRNIKRFMSQYNIR